MKLQTRKIGDEETEKETTQRDQFNTEDVVLAEALVRETHQNSLDASRASTVHTRLTITQLDEITGQKFLALLDRQSLEPHLVAGKIDTTAIDWAKAKLLVIEDFGTSGLTGSIDKKDQLPFSDFWRRIGRSHKSGGDGGRWGLGKLVFSSSSRIRTFFGLTIRHDDPQRTPLLMGQTLIGTHEINGETFDGVLYFSDIGPTKLRTPSQDPRDIALITSTASLHRKNEPGLSIVVPFVREDLTEELILRHVTQNYFFPILTSRLVVDVGDISITAETYADVARAFGGAKLADGSLVTFIKEVAEETKAAVRIELDPKWMKSENLALSDMQLTALREAFVDGGLISIRAPIILKKKGGVSLTSFVEMYIKKPGANELGDKLFIRGSLTLPNEAAKSFPYNGVFAALIATDGGVASFLGDAENPAHTSWSATAEKVVASWINPRERLKEIRGALRALYLAVNEEVERTDPTTLIDTFSLEKKPGEKKQTPKGPLVKRPTVPPIPTARSSYRIGSKHGGFSVIGTGPSDAPLKNTTLRAHIAYDVARGDPFKRYTPLDFDCGKMLKTLSCQGAQVVVSSPNTLEIEISDPAFRIEFDGFDANRDVVVKVGAA